MLPIEYGFTHFYRRAREAINPTRTSSDNSDYNEQALSRFLTDTAKSMKRDRLETIIAPKYKKT